MLRPDKKLKYLWFFLNIYSLKSLAEKIVEAVARWPQFIAKIDCDDFFNAPLVFCLDLFKKFLTKDILPIDDNSCVLYIKLGSTANLMERSEICGLYTKHFTRSF